MLILQLISVFVQYITILLCFLFVNLNKFKALFFTNLKWCVIAKYIVFPLSYNNISPNPFVSVIVPKAASFCIASLADKPGALKGALKQLSDV